MRCCRDVLPCHLYNYLGGISAPLLLLLLFCDDFLWHVSHVNWDINLEGFIIVCGNWANTADVRSGFSRHIHHDSLLRALDTVTGGKRVASFGKVRVGWSLEHQS